ncbi:MAG: pyridoxamine 5'-phosphate oxidase family protein [Sphingomonadales bacterium]|nr:pyridoxamine 5'-phosphate oxidase family protein [Sphingomonadales bacterium]
MADVVDTEQLKGDLWKKIAESPFLMVGPANDSTHSEPLTAQLGSDRKDVLFFFIGRNNRVAGGGELMLQFVSRGHDFFACLHGNARIDNDPTQVDKLWSRQVEAWFPGGKNDPNLALLRVDIDSAELWEADMTIAGKVKMLFGGTIRPDQEGSHAKIGTTAEARG